MNSLLGRISPQSPAPNFYELSSEAVLRVCHLEFNDLVFDYKTPVSRNDWRAQDIIWSKIMVKLKKGYYEIALPWKTYSPSLENYKSVAERRLSVLKKRLQREPLIQEKYKQSVSEGLHQQGEQSEPLGHWCLPHRPVFNPQKSRKVRVLFSV